MQSGDGTAGLTEIPHPWSVLLALLLGLQLLKDLVSIGYRPVGPKGVSPTGPEPGDVEVSPGSSHNIGVPQQGMDSALGDTDYRLPGDRDAGPVASRAR